MEAIFWSPRLSRLTIFLPLLWRVRLGNVIDLEPVAFAAIGEDQQVIVRRGDKQMFEEIAFLGIRADDALAAAALLAVGVDGHPLDVAAVAYR